MDIRQASCRFLADAVQAKADLESFPRKLEVLEKERETSLAELMKTVHEVEDEIRQLGFSEDQLERLGKECAALEIYVDKLRKLERQEGEIGLIKARIEDMRSNIAKAQKSLTELKCRAQEIGFEKEKHAESYLEHEKVMKELEKGKVWLRKESELPVIRERRANSSRREKELSEEIKLLETELTRKQAKVETERAAAAEYEAADRQVRELQKELDRLNREAKELQKRIGGFEQKCREIRRMKENIETIQEELTELAVNEADYDALKLSFSQDGIPHQIVRTILPKLSNTANNILGQMTGGQMGVDFVTEKETSKGKNKKEVVTLDIFIEEFGKGSLPYLSKSGGEKVKASLSVILALAEIKATTAGIQFGMLFIDEPPFLDADGIQAYCDALETIQERYGNIKIMAITHDPTMKARFPQNLDVVKTESGSKVIY